MVDIMNCFISKVVLCDSPKDMEDYIETSQLTTDVGGELEFDSSEWTELRSVRFSHFDL